MFPGLKAVFPKVAVMGLFHTHLLLLAASLLLAGNGNCSSALAWPGPRRAGLAGRGHASLGGPPAYYSLIEMGLRYSLLNDRGKTTKQHSSLFSLSSHSGRRNYPFELCVGQKLALQKPSANRCASHTSFGVNFS